MGGGGLLKAFEAEREKITKKRRFGWEGGWAPVCCMQPGFLAPRSLFGWEREHSGDWLCWEAGRERRHWSRVPADEHSTRSPAPQHVLSKLQLFLQETLCLHLKNPVPIPSPCSVMGNPLPSPLFPVLYVFSRHSWAEPRLLGHYWASDFSAVHCPARVLCTPVMIQCFVSRANIIATLDNTGPFWEWQTAAALLGEHGPFVQRYSRMDRPTSRGATHKATSVLPLALQLRRAPCTMPAALGMPPRAGGQAGGWREAAGKQRGKNCEW